MTGQHYAFKFSVTGLDQKTFSVVSFKGREWISKPYSFDIVLASTEPELDFENILNKSCTLTITGKGEPRVFHGLVYLFRHVRRAGWKYIYQVRLMPQLQKLAYGANARVFLNKSCISIIEDLLNQAGVNFDNRMQDKDSYPQCEYICQFNESNLNFISRWLEAQGIHYFFEQQQDSELLVLSNTNLAHVHYCDDNTPLTYNPPSGLDHIQREDVVHSFMTEHCSLLESVTFKDYQYDLAKAEVTATQQVNGNGQGSYYHYGDSLLGQGYPASSAQVLAQQQKSSESGYRGQSYCPDLRTGTTFELKGHYNKKYNTKYLVYSVGHEGQDDRYLKQEVAGIDHSETQQYNNTFEALTPDALFRPSKRTPVPRYTGVLTAVIDSGGSGEYAEVDEKGRYLVQLPFDSENKSDGKASHYIRLAEPYAGGGGAVGTNAFGMHFPLLKGTEVLISYVDGDIDRPIILSAVYNANNENPVTDKNQTSHVIRTKGGNRIVLEDDNGSESIALASTGGKAILSLGPDGVTTATTESNITASWDDSIEAKCGSSMAFTAGSSMSAFAGNQADVTLGFTSGLFAGASLDAALGGKVELRDATDMISSEAEMAADEDIILKGGMNTLLSKYYKKIRNYMMVAAVSSVAAGVSSWATVAGATDDDLDIHHKSAIIAGSVTGGLSLMSQAVGTAFAYRNYATLKTKKSASFYTTTMELGKSGANLTVRSSQRHPVGCDIKVVDEISSKVSKVSLTPKAKSIVLDNMADAVITLEEGKTISLELKGSEKKIELNGSGISMVSKNHGSFTITDRSLVMQKDNAAAVGVSADGVFIKGDNNNNNTLKVTSLGISANCIKAAITTRSTFSANATMIMLG